MTSIDQMLEAAAERGAERALARRDVAPPAPYPVSVSTADAATMLGVSEAKVREMVRLGHLRRMDIPGSRVVVPTLALLELDPGFTPEHRAQLIRLDVDRDDAA